MIFLKLIPYIIICFILGSIIKFLNYKNIINNLCFNIMNYSKKDYDDIDFSYEYKKIPNPLKTPSEEEIKKILARIFIYRKEDEINCGACGYSSCREKAIAVYNDLADPEFCMPYLKNKAESISNEIIKHTPNAIVTINREGVIVDANESFFDYMRTDKRCVGHFYQDYVALPELYPH